MPNIRVITEGLEFPEGPIAMADGSVILVEIARGTLTRVWGQRPQEVIATLGGGPNGAALGPDGAVYGSATMAASSGTTSVVFCSRATSRPTTSAAHRTRRSAHRQGRRAVRQRLQRDPTQRAE